MFLVVLVSLSVCLFVCLFVLLTIYDSQPFVKTELLLHVQPTTHKQKRPLVP